jgi:oligo-1,6-glucosidase
MHIPSSILVLAASSLAAAAGNHSQAWWKEGVVYQVYPASFKESRSNNSIGWGDIKGITSKLDHIHDLGADIVWLSPFYDSPLQDMGYDISNYKSVNDIFGGSLEDIKEFISEVHRRGMRCLFDLVINHTSKKHKWFETSASSKISTLRDRYFWREPRILPNGTQAPPNNWLGSNGGSAWHLDNRTGEYYLGLFNDFQPDLNWDTATNRQAIFNDALNFWLDFGIDGFRMDAFSIFSKPEGLPNVPANDTGLHDARPLYNDGPYEHEYLREMTRECLEGRDTFTVGEYGMSDNITSVQEYIGASRKEVNSMFLTNMCDIGRDGYKTTAWNLTGWRDAINFTQAAGNRAVGDGWNSVYLENHDLPRSISRFGDDSPEYRVQSGKALAMLLSTLSGTLFLYQGQEIGMINVPSNWTINDYQDANSISYYDGVVKDEGNITQALYNLTRLSRDNARTPFNWDRSGAFSSNTTSWTPAANLDINLADQVNDSDSVYSFWTKMIRLRKSHKDVFVYGEFEFLDLESPDFLAYRKKNDASEATVIINLSKTAGAPPVTVAKHSKLLAHTHQNCSDITYAPFEGRVYYV